MAYPDDELMLDNSEDDEAADSGLAALMAKYPLGKQAYEQTTHSADTARKALQAARERILAQKYNSAIPLLAASAALGAPTRAGSFGESFANMSGALVEPLRDKAAFERQQTQDLFGVDSAIAGVDERTAAAGMKLAEIQGRLESARIRSKTTDRPMSQKEYEYYISLPSDKERADYLEVKRSPGLTVKDVGGVPTLIDPNAIRHRLLTAMTPLIGLKAEAAGKGEIAGAEAAAKKLGEVTAQAQIDLPKVTDASAYMTKLLEDLKTHPGMKYAVGKSSYLPIVKGTEPANFLELLDQVSGKQFLEAYETLKGTGQITEVEGAQAKKAIARMSRAQTEEAFRNGVDEFKEVIQKATARAAQKALAPPPPAAPAAPPANASPAPEKVIDFNKLPKRK